MRRGSRADRWADHRDLAAVDPGRTRLRTSVPGHPGQGE
jgi:hypothetical protein